MGDGGWRRIDAPASRHFLTLLSTRASGGTAAAPRSAVPISKGSASSAPPIFGAILPVSASSARPEPARSAEIFHHRDLAAHPNLIVLEPESERQQKEDRAGRRELQGGQRRISRPGHRYQPVEPAKKER